MKKAGVVAIFVILLLTFFIAQRISNNSDANINGNVIDEEEKGNYTVQVSDEVMEETEKGNDVRVYIQFKDSAVGKRGIASDVKEDIEDSINVKHEFNDKVSAVISEEELESLMNNPNIESIEVVGTRQIVLQNSVGMISANETWNVQLSNANITGAGQTICIIDTGVNYSHSSLGGCFGTGCKVVGGIDYCADNINCTTTDNDPMDAHYHGTHVSGIAAANGSIKGVAPGANLVVIKAANSSGTFWDDDIEKGIEWCVNNATIFNISVISMSLGGGLSTSYCNNDPLNTSINNAVAHNISVVIASGNDGSTSQISAPACHQNATPIGAIAKDDSTFWYNRNSLVLLIAPGREINSTVPSGYGALSGTSMATPHVAGAIALISQFRVLEGSSKYTPSQMEDALNDSGDVKHDSGSGLDYSRIDIYSTLIAIDNSSPEITMNSPSNDTLSALQNQIFNCSAIDALQLYNLTAYVWNSSGNLINQTTVNATNNSLKLSLNLTLANGTYKWNCRSYDSKGNNDYGSSSNYTLKIGAMSLSINSPSDSVYTENTSVNFNCSAQDSIANLANMTFYLWNSTNGLVYNYTKNISGISNSSLFNYSFVYERAYKWNCRVDDSDSNTLTGTNRTITYDNINPVVTLISPADEGDEDAGTINFEYNVSDLNSIDNCSLFIDDGVEDEDNSITRNHTETMSASLSSGSIEWQIKCEDSAGNIGSSSTWDLDVSATTQEDEEEEDEDDESESSSTTGGMTFVLLDEDFEKGVSRFLNAGDSMKFNSEGDVHILKLTTLTATQAKFNISSDPVSLTVDVGETEKADIDSDNIYEIEVKYISYTNTLGNISIKQINETVPTRQIQTSSGNETTGTDGSEAGNETSTSFNLSGKVVALWEKMGKTGRIIFYIVISAAALAVLGFFGYRNRERIMARIPRIEIEIKKRRMAKSEGL